jgi:L-lactate dehydrogenase complex protein LldE
LKIAEMDAAEECCGFGGTFSVKFRRYFGRHGPHQDRFDRAHRRGIVVSIDSSCLMQLQGALSRAKSPVRTMHLAEVLASR